jgi:VWFA-related protein
MCVALARSNLLRGGFLFLVTLVVYVNALPQAPVRSQTQAPVLKAEVRVVLVDVVVTHKKDEPLTGLRREDFQVLEDGKPQTISYFEEHAVAPTSPAKAAPPTLPARPNTFSNVQSSAAPDSVNVLLLDWLNTQPQDRPFAQKQIADYLHRKPAGTSMAAFVLGSHLQMVSGFNSSSSELLAMLEKQKSGGPSRQSSSLLASNSMNAAETQMVDMMRIMQTAPAGIEAVQQEQAENNADIASKRVGITLQAMQELARFLSGLPGRKNVMWFSSAFPINLFPSRGTVPHQFGQELKKTADLLAESRVSIYPVSASGLSQGLSMDMQPQPQPQNANDLGIDQVSNQMAMDALAKDTGGKAFYNTNGIADALAHAVDVGAHYYTLTYSPVNNVMDGKFRKIEVKVTHHGCKVAHRQGYYASDSKAEPADTRSSSDALARIVRFGMPDVAQIPYRVRVSAEHVDPASSAGTGSSAKGPSTHFTLHFSIPLTGLSVESTSDGTYRELVTVLIAAYDFNGKLLNAAERKYPLAMDLGQYAQARQEGLQLLGEIEVPRSELVLRTGISEVNSANVGTLAIPMNESAIESAMIAAPAEAPQPSEPVQPATVAPAPPQPEAVAEPTDSAFPDPAGPSIPSIPTLVRLTGPPCQLADVLPKVAKHIKELVENMNEFTATEQLLRERMDLDGKHPEHEHSSSDYVVTIQNLGEGNYTVAEFHNQVHTDHHIVGGLTASGGPALALVFHPAHLEEFTMTCGDLVKLDGNTAWEIHFAQRKDRPAQISSFQDGHSQFAILLTGTAWIDSKKYQLLRMETTLLQPIPEAKLEFLYQSVDYAPVSFSARKTTLWLPHSVDVTAKFRGTRYHDHHTFADYKLFAIDTGQKIAAPRQPPPAPPNL